MKKQTFLQSLNNAVEGFIYVVKTERNMRIHFLFGFLVLLLGVFLKVDRVEWMLLWIIVTLVWVAEMMNTVIEETIDLIEKNLHPVARVIKDMAAGAVLLSVLNALVVGFFIFYKHVYFPFEAMVANIRYASWSVTFISLLVVLFFVIGGKAFFHRGTPFRGGAISGHSALAFAMWTAVVFAQTNMFVTSVTFLMALLVAQSRLRAKIHSFWEVTVGGILGILVTTLFFQIFRK